MPDAVEEFREHLLAAGLRPGTVVPDDRVHRCGTVERPRSKEAWYVLHADPSVGAYGSWRTGLRGTWRPDHPVDEDPETRRRRLGRIEAERKARQKEETNRQAQAALQARKILEAAPDANGANPYLRRKGVKPCRGLKADGQDLLVPVLDEKGAVTSLQRICPDGSKRFQPGGRVRGCYFVVRGNDGPLLVCEGIATGLSIHAATGRTVLCAFSASNLEAVGKVARSHYPTREITVVADNDQSTKRKHGHNPGVEAAKVAAEAVGGRVVVPGLDGDVNDLHQESGLGAVRRLLSYTAPVEGRRTICG